MAGFERVVFGGEGSVVASEVIVMLLLLDELGLGFFGEKGIVGGEVVSVEGMDVADGAVGGFDAVTNGGEVGDDDGKDLGGECGIKGHDGRG